MPKVSDVWKYFIKIPLEKKVQCKECRKKYAYNTEVCSTNSLLRHLRLKHRDKYNTRKNNDEQQQTNQDQGKSESKDEVAITKVNLKINFRHIFTIIGEKN